MSLEQLSFFPPTRLHDGVPLRPAPEVIAADRGKRIAAGAHHRDLQIARDIARELAKDGREVNADMVRVVLAERHPDIDGPFDFMGSVFRGKEWAPAGWVKSKTPGSHANRLVSWRRREQ